MSLIGDGSLAYCEIWEGAPEDFSNEAKYLYSSMEAITWICDYLWQVKSKTRRDCEANESLSSIEPHVPSSCDDGNGPPPCPGAFGLSYRTEGPTSTSRNPLLLGHHVCLLPAIPLDVLRKASTFALCGLFCQIPKPWACMPDTLSTEVWEFFRFRIVLVVQTQAWEGSRSAVILFEHNNRLRIEAV